MCPEGTDRRRNQPTDSEARGQRGRHSQEARAFRHSFAGQATRAPDQGEPKTLTLPLLRVIDLT